MVNPIEVTLEASFKGSTSITFEIVKEGVPSSAPSTDMLYYSFDPQCASLLFSIYPRHERFSVFPDSFSFSSVSTPSSLLTYAHTVGLQVVAIGDYYASIFSQVRAGSVIFLFGVGSLVCWKIWDAWKENAEDGDPEGAADTPTPRTPGARSKGMKKLLDSLEPWVVEEEIVENFDGLQNDDPSLIQGKYFGPESPVERKTSEVPEISLYFDQESTGDTPRVYRFDIKDSRVKNRKFVATKLGSDSDDAGSLTSELTDECGSNLLGIQCRRKRFIKRQRRIWTSNRNNSYGGRNVFDDAIRPNSCNSCSHRFHPYEHDVELRLGCDVSSSETSPRISETSRRLWQHHLTSFRRRSQGDGSETPDWDQSKKATPEKCLHDSKEPDVNKFDIYSQSRLQPDGEEQTTNSEPQKSLSDELTIDDVLERMKRESISKSLSRDTSLSSRVSKFLTRDNSVSSYLSDLASSDCSDLSMEISAIESSFIDHSTISFVDIEEELNTLKSSMLEMDDEYTKYASKPNPYLLKTTFTDHSIESEESPFDSSRDASACRVLNSSHDSGSHKTISHSSLRRRHSLRREHGARSKTGRASENPSTDTSLSQDDLNFWIKRGLGSRRSSTETSLKLSQDDPLTSLEWDNSALRQYEEDSREDIGSVQRDLERLKFLPDHASLELDLEWELQSPLDTRSPKFFTKEFHGPSLHTPITPFIHPCSFGPISYSTFFAKNHSNSLPLGSSFPCLSNRKIDPPSSLDIQCVWNCDSMKMSTDSAVCSGSRSGSSTPRQSFSQSMMRYESFCNVCSENASLETRLCRCVLVGRAFSANLFDRRTDSSPSTIFKNSVFHRENCQVEICNPCPQCKGILSDFPQVARRCNMGERSIED